MSLSKRSGLRPSFEQPLSTPHFDEEATLLSARPVVPLSEVPKPKAKSRVNWELGAIAFIFMTLVIGAGFMLSETDRTKQAEVKSQPEATAQVPALATAKTDENRDATVATDLEPNTEKPEKRQVLKETKALAENPEKTEQAKKRTVRTRDEDEISDPSEAELDDWRMRRQLRREERRLERRARRDAWLRRDQDRDDVFRVNDIFEGTRRP